MRKLSNSEMIKVEAGLSCIMHGLMLSYALLSPLFVDVKSTVECWNNNH